MTSSKQLKLGLSKPFPCSYLADRDEQLLVVVDKEVAIPDVYSFLVEKGFRRSGDQVYQPYCSTCNACQSIRIPVRDFRPSKSQKRNLKKNADITIRISHSVKDNYYPLYETYINEVHKDGVMYPATREQFDGFIESKHYAQLFVELWLEGELIGVAVTDKLTNGLSAIYTFYDHSLKSRGLGVLSILLEIKIAKDLGLDFLYLGYQIEQCAKMKYKTKYKPYQLLTNNTWKTVNK